MSLCINIIMILSLNQTALHSNMRLIISHTIRSSFVNSIQPISLQILPTPVVTRCASYFTTMLQVFMTHVLYLLKSLLKEDCTVSIILLHSLVRTSSHSDFHRGVISVKLIIIIFRFSILIQLNAKEEALNLSIFKTKRKEIGLLVLTVTESHSLYLGIEEVFKQLLYLLTLRP